MGSYPIMAGTPSRVVHVRLSEDESTKLRDKCAELQMSKSDFIRMCIQLPVAMLEDGDAPVSGSIIGVDRDAVQRLVTEARRWGNNFNQGTRALNTIGLKSNQSASSAEHSRIVLENSARAMDLMLKANDGMQELVRTARAMAEKACVPVSEN